MGKTNRDIEFLYEIGCARFINRSWKRFLNPEVANLSEHIFRVTWIAMILAKREGIKNTEKVLKMALVHDIAESRSGDVDYISRQYVDRNEDQGIKDMMEDTSIKKEFLELIEEYEKRESIEAKIVKDADNLDVDMELMENKEHSFSKGLMEKREGVIKQNMFTESAKQMWDEIYATDPHDWHQNGRNRFSKGDWSQKSENK